MSEHAVDQLLKRLPSQWACILGPQASGKTTYVQYLQQFDSLKNASRSGWHLHPSIGGALGGLHIDGIRLAESIPVMMDHAQPVDASAKGFGRVQTTRDLLHFEAIGGRGKDVAGRLGVHFFDVPGEWARIHTLTEKQRAPLEKLLRETRLMVLLVPFWALLPERWMVENVEQVAGESIWATPMAVATTKEGEGPLSVDREFLAASVDLAHRDVCSWVEAILTVPRRSVDVLIVLSQFQEDAVKAILNGYAEQIGLTEQLGSEVWNEYEALLGQRDFAGHPLDVLSSRFAALSDIGRRLFCCLQKEGPREATDRYAPSPALEALHRLFRFDDRAEAPAVSRQRKNIRSVAIFPQNTVRLTSANLDQFGNGRVNPQNDGDLRMCEDIVWWIVLQLMAESLWTP